MAFCMMYRMLKTLKQEHSVGQLCERVIVSDLAQFQLGQKGIEANAIHGNKSQPQRQRALDEFRRGKTSILVATDVAARGIDIPGVSHVMNYELPNVPEQYVHRIGRTARAGKDGIAIAFCAEDERAYLKDIQRNTDAELERLDLPENFRAVVEGVGPTKPPPRGATRVSKKKVKPKPFGGKKPRGKGSEAVGEKAQARPKQKHQARKGRPNRAGGARPGGKRGAGGGNRNRSRRRSSGG